MTIGGMLTRRDQCILGMYFLDVRYAYDGSDNLIYIGRHFMHNAATTDEKWSIVKLTWDGGNISRQEIIEGAWDNRASLAWGS